MRRTVFVFLAALAVGLVLGAAPGLARQWVGPNEYTTVVSATQSNTAVDFGFDARHVVIVNDGANEVYITFESSVATATGSNGIRIDADETFTADFGSLVEGMGIICSSGETASVRVGAWR